VFTALSVLSLLLCVATLALWVRSYWRLDSTGHFRTSGPQIQARGIESISGEVRVVSATWSTWRSEEDVPKAGLQYTTRKAEEASTLKEFQRGYVGAPSGWFLGFGFLISVSTLPEETIRAIAVPHWFLALLFAILPALHLRAHIRSRRLHRAGHCPRCGYDLRATPERCPECGAEVRSQKSEVSEGKAASPLTSDL
jgi:hypothetical protein